MTDNLYRILGYCIIAITCNTFIYIVNNRIISNNNNNNNNNQKLILQMKRAHEKTPKLSKKTFLENLSLTSFCFKTTEICMM